jgi:hypothetical protein
MKKMSSRFYLPIFIICLSIGLIVFYDCNGKNNKLLVNIDSGSIKDSIYSNDFLGWSIKIPSRFDTIPATTREEIIKKISKDNYDSNGTIKLLGIKKIDNKSTSLVSTLDIKSYYPDYTKPNDWYKVTEDLLNKQLKSNGFTFDFKKSQTDINRITFYSADITFFKESKKCYHQYMIFRFLKDYVLTITIGSDNDKDFKLLFDNLKNSKFKK